MKILKVWKVRTSAYHVMINLMVKIFHRVLHDIISHYPDSTRKNWDFFIAYRAISHSTTKCGPFYLLHGREMFVTNEGKLKAKISPNAQVADQVQRWESFKSSLIKV
jgi:hypothetical protein